MAQRLFVLLFLALAAVALASSPYKHARAAKPRAGSEILRSRQLTKAKMAKIAERRQLIKKGVLRPRASAKVYPTCSTPTVAGYARFPNYDYLGYDLQTVAAANEAVCLDLCKLDSGCIGVFWWPTQALPCYKKNTKNVNSALIQNTPSSTAGAAAVLQGSCSELESIYGTTKTADCCDTTAVYPTCSFSTLASYARFPNWDYPGADVAGNPFADATEAACQTRCNGQSTCLGAFWWPEARCYLKTSYNVAGNYNNVNVASTTAGSSFDIKGKTCNILAAEGSIPSRVMPSCCDSRT